MRETRLTRIHTLSLTHTNSLTHKHTHTHQWKIQAQRDTEGVLALTDREKRFVIQRERERERERERDARTHMRVNRGL